MLIYNKKPLKMQVLGGPWYLSLLKKHAPGSKMGKSLVPPWQDDVSARVPLGTSILPRRTPEAKATAAAMKKQYNVFDYYKVGKPLEGRNYWER